MANINLRYEGDEILKKKSRDVDKIDEKLRVLVDDMVETLHKYNGVGLSAVQVGILKTNSRLLPQQLLGYQKN